MPYESSPWFSSMEHLWIRTIIVHIFFNVYDFVQRSTSRGEPRMGAELLLPSRSLPSVPVSVRDLFLEKFV